ncbi:hypothetical protein D9M72_557580 [compost metagenome]
MHLAGGADQRIEGAGLLEQCANRRRVGDVRVQVAAAAADADDFVTLLEFLFDGFADGAAGTDEDDLHGTGSWVGEGRPDQCRVPPVVDNLANWKYLVFKWKQ